MPGYLLKAMQRFKHPTPTKQQNSPHPTLPQITEPKSNTVQKMTTPPPLDKADTKYIQVVAGTLLY